MPLAQPHAGGQTAHRQQQLGIDCAAEQRHAVALQLPEQPGQTQAQGQSQGDVGQGLLPLQRGGAGIKAQLFPDGGHFGVPAHPPGQPDEQVDRRQQRQIHHQRDHLSPVPAAQAHQQSEGPGGGGEVSQGAANQCGSVVGKGEGGHPHHRPHQKVQPQLHRQGGGARQLLQLSAHQPEEGVGPRGDEPAAHQVVEQPAHRDQYGHADEPADKDTDQPLFLSVRHGISPPFKAPGPP